MGLAGASFRKSTSYYNVQVKLNFFFQVTPVEHAMNMLNNDFDPILTEDPTIVTRPKPSIDEFRARYLSTVSDPIEDEKLTGKLSLTDTLPVVGDGASFTDAYESYYRAGTLGTLWQKTYVLSERMAKNYSRNLLAYGVRAGMYGGMGLMLAYVAFFIAQFIFFNAIQSTIWIKLGLADSKINDRLSVHFYSVAFLAFVSILVHVS